MVWHQSIEMIDVIDQYLRRIGKCQVSITVFTTSLLWGQPKLWCLDSSVHIRSALQTAPKS